MDKARAYEAADGAGQNRVLLAADDPDGGGDFPADSRTIAGLLPASLAIDTAYLGETGTAAVHARLIEAFDEGALLINYLGHGGAQRLTAEGVLTTGDVTRLKNTRRPPVVTAMTCLAGDYGLPGVTSLSEALTLKSGGGAIAVWAPSAMEMNSESVALDRLFVGSLFETRQPVLGAAVSAALAGHASAGGLKSARETYNLLGDPALTIPW